MICKKCGAELNSESAFCPKCGKKVKTSKVGRIFGGFITVAVLGIGMFLYVSGAYRSFMPQPESTSGGTLQLASDVPDMPDTPATEENTEVQESVVEPQSPEEQAPEEPSELQMYLSALSPDPVEMTMGEVFLLNLEKDVPDAMWVSSDENIVQIFEGQLKAIAPGTATVTLCAAEREVPFEVTVFGFSDITLAVGCSKTIEMNDAYPEIRWESSAPEIVSVSDGTIQSLQAGAAVITAYVGEIPYSFEVVATTPEITTTSVRKIIGSTQQVSILGTTGKAEWKSDNTAIATVSDFGFITAEPTGAGQSTKVRAYIDGMEFVIDVAVEPIPQLSSTYKIYGYRNDKTYINARATICTNANETLKVTENNLYLNYQVNDVLNVADADYSDGTTYPLYHSFGVLYTTDGFDNYTDIYLVGTSQTADVLIQEFTRDLRYNPPDDDGRREWLRNTSSVVTYEACENYGIIHVYFHETTDHVNSYSLITVSVDGYEYQFAVTHMPSYPYNGLYYKYFYPDKIDGLPVNFMVEECSVDGIVEKSNTDYSAVAAGSRTYHSGNGWLERIGDKFVDEVEDQAIATAVGLLFKIIF